MTNTIQRQTIIFFLPLSVGAFTNDQSPYTATQADSETGEAPENAQWARRQLYINPQNINIRDQKLIKKDLTKGGYVVQYWGEELPTIEVQGTTGSSGVEGINILKDIYRHEQIVYRSILADRQRALAEATLAAAEEAAAALGNTLNAGETFLAVADAFTGGIVSSTVEGVSNAIDLITDPFGGGTSIGENFGGSGTFSTVPTLAAFATNIDMYYQGEFFRGYFTNFTTTESANDPGHFTYSFSFTVTRRTGERTNFMPWHREPTSYDGETIMSQKTTVNKGLEGSDILSFPRDPPLPERPQPIPVQNPNLDIVVESSPIGPNEETQVPVSRKAAVAGPDFGGPTSS